MTFDQQTRLRQDLHARILEAIRQYEVVTGWQVTKIEYRPGVQEITTEVTEAGKGGSETPSSR
jgi:hypothetical protein